MWCMWLLGLGHTHKFGWSLSHDPHPKQYLDMLAGFAETSPAPSLSAVLLMASRCVEWAVHV